MNHPDQNKWIAYLYGESTEPEKRDLEAHAAVCPDCRIQLEDWRHLRVQLNHWRTSPVAAAPARRLRAELSRWAAAAVLLAGFGFMAGQTNARAKDSERLTIAVSSEVKQQVDKEVQTRLSAVLQSTHTEFAAELRRQLDEATARVASSSSAETKQLVKELAQNIAVGRSQDQQEVLKTLQQIELRRNEDFRTLRSELETVAVMTEASLRKTQNQLVKMAGFTQSDNRSTPGLPQ